MQLEAMKHDFSWEKSAKKYTDRYEEPAKKIKKKVS
jgi:glycogen synthase